MCDSIAAKFDKLLVSASDQEKDQSSFKKLPPEVVAHILSFINDIPSKVSSSGVCRLWRELVDFSSFNQLHLDFARININGSPLQMCKWSKALESLLPKLQPTTLLISLSDRFDHWPPYDAITNQNASFTSVNSLGIDGPIKRQQELHFAANLIESCSSLADFGLSLTRGLKNLETVHSALLSQAVTSLSISFRAKKRYNSDQLSWLFGMVTTPTLKSLSVKTNAKSESEIELVLNFFGVFDLVNWPKASQLEDLEIDFSFRLQSTGFGFSDTDLANFLNLIMPKLKSLKFNVPLFNTDVLAKLCSVFDKLSKAPLSHPVDVFITTSSCKIMEIYSSLTEAHPFKTTLTKEGFTYLPNSSGMKIDYARVRTPIGATVCSCLVCRSEYNWVKQKVFNKLKDGIASIDYKQFGIFSCQVDRLHAEIVAVVPNLHKFELGEGVLTISRSSRTFPFKISLYCHNEHLVGALCPGCGMMCD